MADGNYADILERSWDDIPEPKTLPDGSWLLKGRNAAFIKGDAGKNDRLVFFYTAKEPMEDVPPEDVAALGDYNFGESDVTTQFWIERSKDWDAVRKHLEKHGIDTKGRSQQETLKAFRGTEVVGYVTTNTYTNAAGQTVVSNVASQFAKAE